MKKLLILTLAAFTLGVFAPDMNAAIQGGVPILAKSTSAPKKVKKVKKHKKHKKHPKKHTAKK